MESLSLRGGSPPPDFSENVTLWEADPSVGNAPETIGSSKLLGRDGGKHS